MPARDITIQHVACDPDGGLQVGYFDAAGPDIKENGVLHMHTLIVPVGDEYDDELRAVHEALRYLVNDVLEDLPHMKPVAPSD
jgi:hypothetical protein